jgi:hypothetical protein
MKMEAGFWRTSITSKDVKTCPNEKSCLGGQNGKCLLGYTGPLCMLCGAGYAHSAGECKACSEGDKTTTITVLSLFAVCILLVGVSVHLAGSKTSKTSSPDSKEDNAPIEGAAKQPAADRLGGAGVGGSVRKLLSSASSVRGLLGDHLPSVSGAASFIKEKAHFDAETFSRTGAKVKIVLSFAQVINQIKGVYNIPYPVNFSKFISSLGFVNLDILTMVGMGCVAPFSFYGKLVAMTLIPIVLAAALGIKYKLSASVDVKNKCVAWFLKLTYLVFPGVSTAVFQSFPCITFDTEQPEVFDSFLKADLSLDCNAAERPAMLFYVIVMVIVYPIGITAMYATLLWRQRKAICPIEGKWRSFLGIKDVFPPKLRTMDEEDAITEQRKLDIPKNPELKSIQFLFKEYEPYFWWFEVFECFRRLMLTGGSVMFMEGSATQVVCGMLIALLAIHVYSICQPFVEDDDDVLALGSQWGILFTLFGGLLLKLQLNGTDGYDKDGSGFGAFLILVNVLVMVVGAGTFIYGVYASQITNAVSTFKNAIMTKFGRATTILSTTEKEERGLDKGLPVPGAKDMTTNPAFAQTSAEPTSVV